MGGTYSTCCGPRGGNTKTIRKEITSSPYTILNTGIEAKSGNDWWKPPPDCDFASVEIGERGEKIGETTLFISFEEAQFLMQFDKHFDEPKEWSMYRIALRGTPKNEDLRKKYKIDQIQKPYECKTSSWRWNNKKWTRTIRCKVLLPPSAAIGRMIYSNFPKDNVLQVIECWYLTRSEKKWTVEIYTHTEPVDDMRSIRTIEIQKVDEKMCEMNIFIRFERKDPENSSFMASMLFPRVADTAKRNVLTHCITTTTHSNNPKQEND